MGGSDNKGAQLFHCNYCQRDITNEYRIRCAECEDCDLCLDCFSAGAEIQGHLKVHSYYIHEKASFPLICEGWSAHDEMMLILGLEKYGLGNWEDVSMHVGTHSRKECAQHYYNYYIDCPTGPNPNLSRCVSKTELLPQSQEDIRRTEERLKAAMPKIPPPKPEFEKLKNDYYEGCPPGSSVVGYMPQRDDFDVEYDNEAEQVIAEMAFEDEDSELTKKLKTALLQAYFLRLQERQKRKETVINKGLLDAKKLQSKQHKSKEEKELYQQLRIFSRVMRPKEYEELVQGVLTEHRLRNNIRKLQDARKQGYRTVAGSSAQDIKSRHKKVSKPAVSEDAILDHVTNGSELLTPAENQLCSELGLTAMEFVESKDVVMREALTEGKVSKDKVSKLISVDVNRASKFLEFFVSCGWLPASAGRSSAGTSLGTTGSTPRGGSGITDGLGLGLQDGMDADDALGVGGLALPGEDDENQPGPMLGSEFDFSTATQ